LITPPLTPPTKPAAVANHVASGARWSLCLLLTINLFNYIDRYILAAVVPEVQRDFNASDKVMGLMATAFLLSYMCFAPLFGWLADRYRRWMLIGGAVLVWSLASGATGLAATLTMMFLLRIFVGVGEAAYGPVAPTIIADMYPVARRGQVLAWFYVAIPVGTALGFLLGGRVLAMGFSWHWAFFFVVPPGLLLGVLALLMRDPPREDVAGGAAGEKRQPARLADYKKLLRIPSYLLNTAGMTAMTFSMGGIAFWIPKYLVWRKIQAGELDPANELLRKAALTSANDAFGPIIVVTGLVATLGGGWLGDKLRPRWSGSYFLVSGIAMLLAFPVFLLLPITPFPAAWLLIAVVSFCIFFNTGPTNTILANVTHPSIRAAGFALNIFIIHALGDACSPFVIGWINEAFEGKPNPVILAAGEAGAVFRGNMDAGFMAVSGMIFLSGLLWLWGARYLERDTQRALL
jgi:MFS transporter, Spinster family, sphingosine-1-phosphate transporter